MQHYRISKAAPILSYLPRFIKIVWADFERSANMPKHPLINYPPSNLLLHKTPKNRISVPYPEFHLPLVQYFRLQQPSDFLKTTFSDSWDLKTWRFMKTSWSIFSRWKYFSYQKSFFFKSPLCFWVSYYENCSFERFRRHKPKTKCKVKKINKYVIIIDL